MAKCAPSFSWPRYSSDCWYMAEVLISLTRCLLSTRASSHGLTSSTELQPWSLVKRPAPKISLVGLMVRFRLCSEYPTTGWCNDVGLPLIFPRHFKPKRRSGCLLSCYEHQTTTKVWGGGSHLKGLEICGTAALQVSSPPTLEERYIAHESFKAQLVSGPASRYPGSSRSLRIPEGVAWV